MPIRGVRNIEVYERARWAGSLDCWPQPQKGSHILGREGYGQ